MNQYGVPLTCPLEPSKYIDDPDIILGQLKCRDRVNYCKINPELWKKCKERDIHDKYILPCKMDARINKKINEVCEGGYYPDNEEFNEMLDELLEEYPCLMEQNILSYLKRYLSYGDKSETVLEYRVYFDVRRNRFTGMAGMNVIDGLVELERIKWGKMWNPDDFLDAVNNFIGVERIKEMIEEWPRMNAWDWDDEDEEIYQTMKRHQEEYIEGSLIWWVSMLNCKLVPFIRDTTSPYTMVDKRIFRFLLEMEACAERNKKKKVEGHAEKSCWRPNITRKKKLRVKIRFFKNTS